MEINKKLSEIEENLKLLLEEQPRLRKVENKRELWWEYFKRFDGLTFGITKEMFLYRLTNIEYLGRALRKLQAKVKKVDDLSRYEKENKFLKGLKPKDKKEFKEVFGDEEK